MGKFLVGLGLVVMLGAVSLYVTTANDPSATAPTVDQATFTAFWTFVAGTLIAIVGALRHGR